MKFLKFLFALLILILFAPIAEAHGHWTVQTYIGIAPGYYASPPIYYAPPPVYYYPPAAPVYVMPQAPQPVCRILPENVGGYIVNKTACLSSDGHWYFVN